MWVPTATTPGARLCFPTCTCPYQKNRVECRTTEMAPFLFVALVVVLVAHRPWRSHDGVWFDVSALLVALLLGGAFAFLLS